MALESTDFYMVTAQVLANIQNTIEKKILRYHYLISWQRKTEGKVQAERRKITPIFMMHISKKKSNPERDLPPR